MLHSFKYGESKLIVDMFTRQQGRLSFVAALPKSGRGRLKKQYFQPLTLLSIECDVRPQQQLQKLRDASLLTPLPQLTADPQKLAISLFLAEFLYHALRGEQQNEPLFSYVAQSIVWLDGRETLFANFHLVVLMHLTRFLGFYPNLEDTVRRGEDAAARRGEAATTKAVGDGKHDGDDCFFDLRAGTFCSDAPLHHDFLMPQEARLVRLMMRMDFGTMHLFRLSRAQRNRCVQVALQFYRLHLPAFPELRSLEVLSQLWQ